MDELPSPRTVQRKVGQPAREAVEGTLQACLIHLGTLILGSNKDTLIALDFQIWKEGDEDQNPIQALGSL